MPQFHYTAYDRQGVLQRGTLEARERDAALDALHRRGMFPLDVTAAKAGGGKRWWEYEIKLSSDGSLDGLAQFTRELATLVKAEIPIDKALSFVGLQPLVSTRMRTTAAALAEAVRGGAHLSAAMADSGAFPDYYWHLVRAGEQSGSLGSVLSDLAQFLERSQEVRSQITSALLYPAVLLVAALGAVGVIVTVLIPTILPLFADAGATPPFILAALAGAAAWLKSHWLVLLIAVAAVAAALSGSGRVASVKLAKDQLLLRLPLVGRLVTQRETARFTRTLALLIGNGVAIVEAVAVASAALKNQAFRNAAAGVGKALSEGKTLTAPMAESGVFSELALGLIAIGEQTGQLDTMLNRVAAIYEASFEQQMKRAVALISPVLTLVIGGLVGGLILSAMGAILSVNDLVLQ